MINTTRNLYDSATLDIHYPHPAYGSDVHTSTETWVGQRTTLCGQKIKGNFRDPNPWYYEVLEQRNPLGTFRWRRRVVWYTWPSLTPVYGYITYIEKQPNGLNPVRITRAQALLEKAREQAYERLTSNARGNLDLSVDAFQARQNIRMFRVIDRVEKSIARLKFLPGRSKTDLAVKSVKYLGSKWLEWVYGVKPLIEDIYSIAEESLRYNVNKTVKVKGTSSIKETNYEYVSGVWAGQTKDVVYKLDSFAKSKFQLELKSPDQYDPATMSSLNPISIAWELIPFSFVVDWFYDFGGYLRGAETALIYKSRFIKGFESQLFGVNGSGEVSGSTSYSSLGIDQSVSFQATGKYRNFQRTILTSYPFPRAPVLKIDMGSGRLLNAAALLSQFLHR